MIPTSALLAHITIAPIKRISSFPIMYSKNGLSFAPASTPTFIFGLATVPRNSLSIRPQKCALIVPPRCAPLPPNRKQSTLYMCSNHTNPQQESKPPDIPQVSSPEVKELKTLLKKCPLYLIGPMGSGKSALAKLLASQLRFHFLDTDQLIEAAAKRSISEIFEEEGEESFRDFEASVLEQVSAFVSCCVATGGGIVIRKSNWGSLRTGIVVYLEAPVDVLRDRLENDKTRPLLKSNDAETLRDRIQDILEERRHLYDQADVTVHIEKTMSVDAVAKDVIQTLTNFIKTNPPRSSRLYPGTLRKKNT